jgi:hypothetical protein
VVAPRSQDILFGNQLFHHRRIVRRFYSGSPFSPCPWFFCGDAIAGCTRSCSRPSSLPHPFAGFAKGWETTRLDSLRSRQVPGQVPQGWPCGKAHLPYRGRLMRRVLEYEPGCGYGTRFMVIVPCITWSVSTTVFGPLKT